MKYFRSLRISGGVIFMLLILILVAGPVIGFFLKQYLIKTHSIQIEKLQVNIFSGSISCINIRLTNTQLSNMTLSGIAKSVHVTGIGMIGYLFYKDINVNNIIVEDAVFSAEVYKKQVHKNNLPDDPKRMTKFSIGEIQLLNSFISVSDIRSDSLKVHIDNLSLIQVATQGSAILIENLSFNIKETRYITHNNQYKIGWSQAVCEPGNNFINIDSFSVIPVLDPKAFFDKEKYQTDRFSMFIPEIVLKIPVSGLSTEKYSLHGTAVINSGHLQVIRDKNKDREKDDIKPVLQDVIKSIPVNLLLDSIIVNSFNIRYTEIPSGETVAGSVDFMNVNALISNINSGEINEGKLIVDARAIFMDEGKLTALLEFPYGKYYFDCTGSLEKLPFRKLNLISEPLALVSFSNGKINKMMFNFRADSDSSRGDLLFYYSNLGFAIARNAEGDTSGLKSQVLSFIADDLLIADSNPDKNGIVMKGIIRQKRNNERFIFNYMWKSIFSGVKSTVLTGVPKEKKRGRKE